MGFGKFNIWIRNEKCEVVSDRAHLHVYDCHGTHVLGRGISGHTEVEVPPGCYIVTAGLYTGHGNIYTDKTMIIVGCDETACVNLVLNRFREENKQELLRPIAAGCAVRFITPLYINAKKADIPEEELITTLKTIAKAADIDMKQMGDALMCELRDIEEEAEQIKKAAAEEEIESREYVNMLKDIARLFKL
jgi:hypothetical protein